MKLVALISGMLRAFNRRYEHSKIHQQINRRQRRKIRRADGRKVRGAYQHVIIYCTSRLRIKREMSQGQLQVRRYKRLFRGVCGALTWKDFDRMQLKNAA